MVLNTNTHGFNAFIAGIERNFAHSSFGLRQHQRRVAGPGRRIRRTSGPGRASHHELFSALWRAR
jgi:hypothetical protein